MRKLGLLLSLSVCAALPAQGPANLADMPTAVDPELFTGLNYRLLGPSRGGRSTMAVGVPGNPNTYFMGVASGGLFRTTNAGLSWLPVTDGQVPLGSTGALAIADSDFDVMYLGTGSDGVRSNVSPGHGVYKSTDGGDTWKYVGLYDVGQIGSVKIHPNDANTVWVAATGDVFKSGKARGIYKTSDGGESWRQVLSISDKCGAMDVELQPFNPDVVYAWMSYVERKPWTIISGSEEGGFYKSTDGGENWNKVTRGLPNDLIGKGNLAVTAAKPDRIYALVEAKPGGGLYRSDDSGESWNLINDQGSLIQRPFYYTTLGADPTDANVVYAGAEGLFKSSDGGVTMQRFRTPHGDNHDIWVSPEDGQRMIQANDGGANVSFDGGKTWSTQSNQVTSEIYGVWVDNAFPYKLYGAQQDNSTIIISSLAEPFNRDDWRSGPGCETGPIIPHPTNPDIVYGACKGKFEWMNMRTGMRRAYWVGNESLYGSHPKDLMFRLQRVSPMEASLHDPDVLYHGSQYVHRTRDKGVTWEIISPDLTWNPPEHQLSSGGPITRDATGEEIYSVVYQIRESVHDADVIWVGANDGPYHVTRDGGKSWKNITPPDLPEGGRVQSIEPSPHREGSAYYVTHRYLLGDYQPYIFRTDDFGETWKRLTDGTNGIPADWPTRVVREDPSREGLLYAGTEFGMFISFDNGERWQSFHLNMPHVPITDMKVHQKDLVISTQGRAFWILDNLSSVQQIGANTSPKKVALYKPRDGYRTDIGRGLLNPTFEYYLPAGSQGPVSFEILDADGELVNTYSSADGPAKPTPAVVTTPDPMMAGREAQLGRRGGAARGQRGARSARGQRGGRGRGRRGRGGIRPQVTLNEGLNRFAWNVRHELGLAATPGDYRLRMKVGDVTFEESFTVLIDPRLSVDGITVADLGEQFEHSLRMRELNDDLSDLVAKVEAAQANTAKSGSKQAVDAVAGKLFTESFRYGVPGLQAQIRYLGGATRPDQKLGSDVRKRYAQMRSQLDELHAAFEKTQR